MATFTSRRIRATDRDDAPGTAGDVLEPPEGARDAHISVAVRRGPHPLRSDMRSCEIVVMSNLLRVEIVHQRDRTRIGGAPELRFQEVRWRPGREPARPPPQVAPPIASMSSSSAVSCDRRYCPLGRRSRTDLPGVRRHDGARRVEHVRRARPGLGLPRVRGDRRAGRGLSARAATPAEPRPVRARRGASRC